MTCNLVAVRLSRRRRFSGWTVVLVFSLLGCGGEKLVAVSGRVEVEGRPASGGRLMLTPTGEGKRTDALVEDSGRFSLRTAGELGALPGAYHVLLKLAEPSDATSAVNANGAATDEATLIYESPRDQPVVVADRDAMQLRIDVRRDAGWTRTWSH